MPSLLIPDARGQIKIHSTGRHNSEDGKFTAAAAKKRLSHAASNR
jgi:hypothetical protein